MNDEGNGASMGPLNIRIAIPHYFRENPNAAGEGYGSDRVGNRLARSLAFARCLGSLLSLNRSNQDWILNHAERKIESISHTCISKQKEVIVEIHLFVCGEDQIKEVTNMYLPRITIHQLELKDPRQLPLAAVRQLIEFPNPATLSMYLEDDLIIQDPQYIEKIVWFNDLTDHKFVLMPHRYEPTVANAPKKLYVDGPIKMINELKEKWSDQEVELVTGYYQNEEQQSFVEALNPHSGSFCLSNRQLKQLKKKPWPPQNFVGPLETAATGTVLNEFRILKPSLKCRHFLQLEHGNPSFLQTLNQLPRKDK